MRTSDFSFFKIFLLGYAILLGISWSVEFYFSAPDLPNRYQKEERVVVGEDTLQISYYHLHQSEQQQERRKTVLLLTDNLFDMEFILPAAEELFRKYDVLIPHYADTDYSGKSVEQSTGYRAKTVRALLDTLGPENIHLVVHGYGGAVALDLLNTTTPQQYNGIVFLASLGVMELQFLGNYTINRSLYALLYPVIKFYKYFFPHFGWYDEQPLDEAFIKTSGLLDLQDARKKLKQIELPSLILHPAHDRYVPVLTALENHRLIPQSFFIAEPGRHMDIKEKPEVWTRHIFWFFNLVESGRAPEKGNAVPERVRLSQEPFDMDDMESIAGWTLAFIIILLAFSTLISEDLACIAGGLIVVSGVIDFWGAVLGCFLGIFIADTATYWVGRWTGKPILGWIPFRWIVKEKDIARAEEMFELRGAEIIFMTRFIPGTRFPVYLAAGILKTHFAYFLGYFLISILIWVPLMVGLSVLIGQPMLHYLEIYQDYALWIFIFIVLMIYGVLKVLIPLTTVRGRRRMIVKWMRMKEKLFRNELR